MKIINQIDKLRSAVSSARSDNKKIGFVPTMGALHDGHRSLIERAVTECDFVIVSIFVNPTQFEQGSDYDSYPRTLDADAKICKTVGADIVFAPNASEMYPKELLSWVQVEKMTEGLCGAFRKGHFKGVTTVCAKLFNIVQADRAYFGKKDAQQLAVIKKMVSDLNFPLEIIGCETVREPDGLAMSSRNKYLTEQQRKQAPLVYASLQLCEFLVSQGQSDVKFLKSEMEKLLGKGELLKPEYIEFVDAATLDPVDGFSNDVLVAIACYLGKARLIDNITITPKS